MCIWWEAWWWTEEYLIQNCIILHHSIVQAFVNSFVYKSSFYVLKYFALEEAVCVNVAMREQS